MKFLNAPLAALSASFVTWYWLEQKELQPGGGLAPPSSLPDDASKSEEAPDAGRLAEALHRLERAERRAAELQDRLSAYEEVAAPEADDLRIAAGAGDPFRDMWDAGIRSGTLLWDAVEDAGNAVAEQIWQWPVDSAAQLPQPGSLRESAASLATSAVAAAAPAAAQLRSWALEVASLLPPEFWRQLAAVTEELAVPLASVRTRLAGAVEAFLKRHPEHRASLEGRSPAVVLLLLLALVQLTIWELYGCAKLALRLLRASAVAASAPCRCLCGRRRAATVLVAAPGPVVVDPVPDTPETQQGEAAHRSQADERPPTSNDEQVPPVVVDAAPASARGKKGKHK